MIGIGLGLDSGGRVFLQALHAEALKRRQDPRARLDGVGRGDQVGPLLASVCRWVRVLPHTITRGDWPGGNMDLLAAGGIEGLEERVHVFPAVELAETADLDGF